MTQVRSGFRSRLSLALAGALLLVAGLIPSSVIGVESVSQSYVVVLEGGYALDGSYALGQGYALVAEQKTYALDGTYALGRQYALYALDKTYALLGQYALTDAYALTGDYALFGQYALDSGYALVGQNEDYALGQGYALAAATAAYALDSTYALTEDTAAYALDSNYALLDAYALDENYALARDYALYAVGVAGGVVTADLTRQAGILVVESKNTLFAETLSTYALVEEVGLDFSEKHLPTRQQAIDNGRLTVVTPPAFPTAGKDALEDQQWGMAQIRARQAEAIQAGQSGVRVGVVDSGIDGNHVDFVRNGASNVDCGSGADFTADGPGVGNPLACVDNNFHGTHVAGIIAARRNGLGVVGVAPNVTLVPIKVCDGDGHCYVSDVVQGITHAGDLGLNAINMSFFVDDAEFQQSTEFKCQSDETQRAYVEAVERSLAYARKQGVSLIAALGNSDTDLANPPGGKDCKTVPAMSPGVVGTVALGDTSEKAWYSSYGAGWADVSAPGGGDPLNAGCVNEVLSTIPGGWGCFQGTSMASPHTTGVAALIISQFGKNGNNGYRMDADKVAMRLTRTAIDIGAKGYDKCFGNGRVDALRAVQNDSTYKFVQTPACPE
jgi:subtilisin family serine protease